MVVVVNTKAFIKGWTWVRKIEIVFGATIGICILYMTNGGVYE